MRFATAFSDETCDMALAAEELVSGIKQKLSFQKNTCAMLLCDTAMDFEPLLAELNSRLPCDVIGVVALATFDKTTGYHDTGSILQVITADDVSFSFAGSGVSITPENLKDSLKEAYGRAYSELGFEPGLIFLCPMTNIAIPYDDYVTTLDELSGGVPIFGGYPSSFAPNNAGAVLFDGKSYTDRFFILLMGGSIKPVFVTGNVECPPNDSFVKVTKSSGSKIYTVDDNPFLNYWRSRAEFTDEEEYYKAVLTNESMLIAKDDVRGDGFTLVRTLLNVNREDDSAVFTMNIPEGSLVSKAYVKRKEIDVSFTKALSELFEKIKKQSEEGYNFSAILCVSCAIRNIVLASSCDHRVNVFTDAIPEPLDMCGFFAFGEFAPVNIGDKLINRSHNVSLVFCAI